jgi:hypothetical protein
MKVELLDQRAPDQSGHLLIQLNGHDQQIGIERLFEMELDALANHFYLSPECETNQRNENLTQFRNYVKW